MDELRESSLLFSLEGLLETERERVQREAREAQRRRDEEMIRVAEQASRRRLAQEQARAAQERRQALERERERLEEERIDAMKRATVERARIETEAKMRLIEVDQTRKHELAMSQLREQQSASRYRTLTWLSSAGCALAVLGATASYFGYVQPAHARAQQQLQAIIDANSELAKTTQRALVAEQGRNRALVERLERLAAAPAVSLPPTAKPQASPSKPPPGTPRHVQPPPHRCRDTGDPLDGCIH
jgi:hypothetical protein